MTREEKVKIIEDLKQKFASTSTFYIADASGLTVGQVNKFRKLCHDRGLEYRVFKNTLIEKALESMDTDYAEFNKSVLKGFSGIIFSSEVPNTPAKVLKEFHKSSGGDRPSLKGASIDSALYIGASTLEELSSLKSKNELIGELIGLLQSPAKKLVLALQSGKNTLSGIVKTLSDKAS